MISKRKAIIHSYRALYRHALQAVQYSSPARQTLRNHLQLAYRNNAPEDFDSFKINNTIEFLQHATRETGLEHRMLKTLLHVWWWQGKSGKYKREYVAC